MRFTKDGYAPHELTLTGTLSGGSIGNILFGGLIGLRVVDPQAGAMYRLEQKSLEATLTPIKGCVPVEESGLRIVSLIDLPANKFWSNRG